MAREDIIEKLNKFIVERTPVIEESQAVYIMVEIRKILDHNKDHWRNGDFTLLRFYCDWTVHTDKTRITESMKSAMQEIFQDIKYQMKMPVVAQTNSSVTRFVYMEALRAEMKRFLEEHNINLNLVDNGWMSFVKVLVKVLENQEMLSPTDDIVSFTFLPANDGCVVVKVVLGQQINGYDYYKFGNAY